MKNQQTDNRLPNIERKLSKNEKLYLAIKIQGYKDAVWDFLLEHCDVLDSGALFFKFHASGRQQLENRMYARLMGYHREDTDKKEKLAIKQREDYEKNKQANKERYDKNKKKGHKKLALAKIKEGISLLIK